jgi:hypothetical protein
VGKPEGKISVRRPRRRWKDGIEMGLQGVRWRDLNWTDVGQDKDR